VLFISFLLTRKGREWILICSMCLWVHAEGALGILPKAFAKSADGAEWKLFELRMLREGRDEPGIFNNFGATSSNMPDMPSVRFCSITKD
jgi:hypothetical protein